MPPDSRIERMLHGTDPSPSTYLFSSWLFPRLIGVVTLIAFLSFWSQYEGLIGTGGILPFDKDLKAVAAHCESNPDSPAKNMLRPTLLWLWKNPDNTALQTLFIFGTIACILTTVGITTPLSLAIAWICYLSLYSVGGLFLRFQWDILLLETLFLTIIACRWKSCNRRNSIQQFPAIGRWLLWLLLFKLMFESGLVKLTYFGSGKENAWRDLTALRYHYWTQPIPAWTSWHIHNLPEWFDRLSLRLMLVIELVLPFLFFLPRRLRHSAALAQVALQVVIICSGNYGYFNLLTIILCVPLFDDQCLPNWPRKKISKSTNPDETTIIILKRVQFVTLIKLGLIYTWMGKGFVEQDFRGNKALSATNAKPDPPEWEHYIKQHIRLLHIANSYGLFRVMTTTRPEIEISGSDNGVDWRRYTFRWKPGATERKPGFFFPHMPRLDWQMWFAGFQIESGTFQSGSPRWFVEFISALAEQRAEVLSLLEENPFPEEPPRQLRLRLHHYKFTTAKERRDTGDWWKRELIDRYTIILPVR
ncbi:MAG: lipase maturation factor family protein [Opitutae bacterium]|nr:lipase maturation factor family protein [Opitutae bacterium]